MPAAFGESPHCGGRATEHARRAEQALSQEAAPPPGNWNEGVMPQMLPPVASPQLSASYVSS
jgi:hypothetical protein